VKQTHKQSI